MTIFSWIFEGILLGAGASALALVFVLQSKIHNLQRDLLEVRFHMLKLAQINKELSQDVLTISEKIKPQEESE
jgi:hypothetical protein